MANFDDTPHDYKHCYGGLKSKLTSEQKVQVKRRLAGGESKVKFSKEYDVSRANILNIERS